jgi:hypothetical protein
MAAVLKAGVPSITPVVLRPSHQEAIYEIAEEKYFGGEEFLRQTCSTSA